MSRSRPGVGDVFLHSNTGPRSRPSLSHCMIWAFTAGGDAVLVPIGSRVRGFPEVAVDDLPPKVLKHASCLLVDQVKLEPAAALASAILDGSRPHLCTCTPVFLAKVLEALRHPTVPTFVSRLLPPAGRNGPAPRRPTLPSAS